MKIHLLTTLVWFFALGMLWAQPVITTQPQPQTKFAGESALLSVEATGTPPLSFQWLKASAPLAGQTNATLLLTNLQAADRGIYAVTVSNGAGPVTSDGVEVTVVTPPTITPANPTASLFADLKLTARATPAGPMTYQWLFKGDLLAGERASTLTLTNIQKLSAGNYSVVASYSFGAITSAVETLKITQFNSMYCFGYSWTDTHNCTWNPTQFYKNRACNGPMWPEFLSTNLGLAYLARNNYAVCGATAPVIFNQVANLPTPPHPELSLFCTWINGPDVPPDPKTWTEQILQKTLLINSNMVARLYSKGARAIVVQLDPQFEKLPGYKNDYGGPVASNYFASFNTRVKSIITEYAQAKPDLRLHFIDTYSKLNEVLANSTHYGFTKTDIGALDDRSLLDKSFAGPGADYVFWDWTHGTTKLHQLIAAWHLKALTSSVLEQLDATTVGEASQIQMNHLLIGRDYTFQGSPDLNHWQDLQTFTAAAGTNQWAGTADNATTFYRLRW